MMLASSYLGIFRILIVETKLYEQMNILDLVTSILGVKPRTSLMLWQPHCSLITNLGYIWRSQHISCPSHYSKSLPLALQSRSASYPYDGNHHGQDYRPHRDGQSTGRSIVSTLPFRSFRESSIRAAEVKRTQVRQATIVVEH